jgi:hypothetical protein
MGANDVLPTVPTFVLGESSITHLQQLAYCASFLIDCDVRPEWHGYSAAETSISATTWTDIGSGTAAPAIAYDSDGVLQGIATPSLAATIVTQGIYCVEMSAGVPTPSATDMVYIGFLWTAGTHNAEYTNGTNAIFGVRATETLSTTGGDTILCTSDVCPVVCYPGDVITPRIYTSAATTMQANVNSGTFSGRFNTNFTGYLVSMGT